MSLLWSFARLGFDPGYLLNRMLTRLECMLEDGISGQAITNTLWAMAVLQARPPPTACSSCQLACLLCLYCLNCLRREQSP